MKNKKYTILGLVVVGFIFTEYKKVKILLQQNRDIKSLDDIVVVDHNEIQKLSCHINKNHNKIQKLYYHTEKVKDIQIEQGKCILDMERNLNNMKHIFNENIAINDK